MDISNNVVKPKRQRKKIVLTPVPSSEPVPSSVPDSSSEPVPSKKPRKRIILKNKPKCIKVKDAKKNKTYYLERPIRINNICFTDEELKQKIKVLCVMECANETSNPIFHYP